MPNEIIAGLNNLSSYLRGENELRKKELDKEKQRVASQRIATGFKSLTAENTESDARQLVYSLINDAASLDSLDATLPLIDSLYRDTTNAIKQQKLEKQDQALGDYAKTVYSNLPSGLSGTQKFDVAKYEESQKKDVNTFNQEGQKLLTTMDRKDRVINQLMVDPRGDRQQEELKFEYSSKLARYQHGLQSSLKAYAGLTDEGLPLLMGSDGLYVQKGGKLIKYDETQHGGVVRGTSQDKPYKDAQSKLNYWQDARKTYYSEMQDPAATISSMLGLEVSVGPDGKPTGSAVSNLLSKKGFEITNLWKAIDQYSRENGKDQEWKNAAYNNYAKLKVAYASHRDTESQIAMGTTEQKYGLPLDAFTEFNDSGYKLLDENLSTIPQNSSADDVGKMISNSLITQAQGYAWLEKKYLRDEATRNNVNLSSNDEYKNFYNKLGYDAKGQLFSKLKK